jgi:hypothetical protein
MADVTTQNINYRSTSLPDYLDKPYQEYMGLYGGQVAADLKAGAPDFGKDRIAGLSEVQTNAMNAALEMAPAAQLKTATGLMGAATANALNTDYTPGQYNAQNFGSQVGGYMSPYMQGVVDIQQREAQRQADIAGTQRGARAAQAGAFGGSRQGIENAEAARNLAMQKGDIQAQGLQNAFTQAANQYNVGNQLSEQSRQYGAGIGLQGQQAAMQGAGALGTLGNLQYQQGMGINQLQAGYGGMQQDIQQQKLNTQYQDFLNKQNYPYQLLNQYGNVLNKQPANMNTQQVTYGQAPSLGGQLIGAAGSFATAPKLFAEGGMVQGYAGGGVADSRDVTDQSYIAKLISKMSPPQLQAILGNPSVPRAQKQMAADRLEDLMQMQASSQRGLLGAAENTPSIQEMYPAEETAYGANGGIVAFADGDVVSDPDELTPEDYKTLPSLSGIKDFFTPKAALENRRKYEAGVAAERAAKEETATRPAPAAPTKQPEASYDERTATRRSDFKGGSVENLMKQFDGSDTKGLSAALKGLPTSYKEQVLASAKELGAGDKEVIDELEKMLGKDKKRSEDFKSESSRMYWNKFFSNMAKESAKGGPSGFLGITTAAAAAAGDMPEYESQLRKEQTQYDLLAEKNKVDTLKYKIALKDKRFDDALGLEKAIRDNQFNMAQLQRQAADSASRTKLGMAQLEQTGRYQQGMLDVYKGKNEASQAANKVRLAGMEAKVMPLFQSDPNTRKLAKQLEEQYGKNWQSQPGPQQQYWSAYQTFKARTMPSLMAESDSSIPYSDSL